MSKEPQPRGIQQDVFAGHPNPYLTDSDAVQTPDMLAAMLMEKDREEQEEEEQRAGGHSSIDPKLYTRLYDEVEQAVKFEHPYLSGRDFRLEVKHMFRTRFYEPDMESMKNERSGRKEYTGAAFEVLENGDLYYPQSGRTMMELYERTRRYKPELFSESEYATAILVMQSIKNGARSVSFPSYNRDEKGNEKIRDVYTLVIEGNAGHIVTRNVAGDGPQYSLDGMHTVMQSMFSKVREVHPVTGVYIFTDVPPSDQEAKQAVATAFRRPVLAFQPAVSLSEYHPVAGIPVEPAVPLFPLDRHPLTVGSADLLRKKTQEFLRTTGKKLTILIDRSVKESEKSVPLFIRWALGRETPKGNGKTIAVPVVKEAPNEQKIQPKRREQVLTADTKRLGKKETAMKRRLRRTLRRTAHRERQSDRPSVPAAETKHPNRIPAPGEVTPMPGLSRKAERRRFRKKKPVELFLGLRKTGKRREKAVRHNAERTQAEQRPKASLSEVLPRRGKRNRLEKRSARILRKSLRLLRMRELPPEFRKSERNGTPRKPENKTEIKRKRKEATAGTYVSLLILLILQEMKPNGPVGQALSEKNLRPEQETVSPAEQPILSSSPWVLFSIIWYLNMLRESGFVKTGPGKKKTKKTKRQKQRNTGVFPRSGTVFAFVQYRGFPEQNML